MKLYLVGNINVYKSYEDMVEHHRNYLSEDGKFLEEYSTIDTDDPRYVIYLQLLAEREEKDFFENNESKIKNVCFRYLQAYKIHNNGFLSHVNIDIKHILSERYCGYKNGYVDLRLSRSYVRSQYLNGFSILIIYKDHKITFEVPFEMFLDETKLCEFENKANEKLKKFESDQNLIKEKILEGDIEFYEKSLQEKKEQLRLLKLNK